MILAGDIGGTKTHLALFEQSEAKHWVSDAIFHSKEYDGLTSLLDAFFSKKPVKVHKACFGVAGLIKEGRCRLTNLPWVVDAAEISKKYGIPHVWIVNDLEANAYGLRCLEPKEFYTINEGDKKAVGNAALIAAGTGLGEAGLYWNGKKHLPFACEGGHCSFAAENELEVQLLFYLKKEFPHVSYERILSGPGLYHLYRFFIDTGLEREKKEVAEAMRKGDPAKVVTENALKELCPACVRALNWFVSIYGSEAGNLALKMLSKGGVYIGGGIAPKILEVLKRGGFMSAFASKGRFAPLLTAMPVRVILNENTALLGAAEYAKERNN